MNEIKIKNIDETIYEYESNSGLKVYVWPYDLSDQISISLNIKYGSIHTEFKYNGKNIKVPNGIAHFLEHIKFNIKKDVTAHDVYNKLGSYVNAYTTFDHTSYEVVCTSKIKDNLINLLDFVYNPYFTKELIKKEKPIIIEEAKTVLDNPYNKGYFALENNIYHNSKYKELIVGMPDEIKRYTLEDVLNVYNAFYHPSNSFLVVTGNVNPYEIEKIIDEYFDNKKFIKKDCGEIKKIVEKNTVIKEEEIITSNVTKEKLILAFKYPKKIFNNYSIFDINNLIDVLLMFNIGSGSNLKEELYSKCIVDSLYYFIEDSEDAKVVFVEVSTDYPKEVEQRIINQINNLNIDEKEFNLQMKVMIAETILGYEDATQVNNSIKRQLLTMNRIIDNKMDLFKGYSMDKINDVIVLLKKYTYSKVLLKPNLR